MSVLSRSEFLIATASTVALPRVAQAQSLETIRLTGVPTDDLTPVYYAMRNGLYQKAGLDVQMVPASSGTSATQAVVSGAYEIGKGSLIASMIAHLRGLPLVVVANGLYYDTKSPFTVTLVAADSTIRKAADLNGTTCASQGLKDLSMLALTAWIDKNGGDSKSVKWIEIPNSVAAAALEQHRIAAYSFNEPQLTAAMVSGKTRVLAHSYDAISPFFTGTIFFARPDWAEKNADALKRWVKVTYDAAAYTNKHHAETAAMMSDVTKIPLETFEKISRVSAATTSDPRTIQAAIDLAAKYGYIEQAFPAKDLYFSG